MIISASYKTDIPAFYGDWFMARLRAGHCRTVNPYGRQVQTIALDRGSVDGFVFWTRNAGPFRGHLEAVAGLGQPFVVHLTVTGYPRPLDAATIDPGNAIDQVRWLARTFGGRVPVWRYDPVVISSLTPPAWHRRNFSRLARAMSGSVDEVVLSFAQIYRKTARNMAAAARVFGFDWHDPDDDEKRALLADLAAIAADHGFAATVCGQPNLVGAGIGESRCIDARRLGDVAGDAIAADARPHRKNCGCRASRDIGEYDTCPHGCAYCYAVNGRTLAKERYRQHDPGSDFLFAPPSNIPQAN